MNFYNSASGKARIPIHVGTSSKLTVLAAQAYYLQSWTNMYKLELDWTYKLDWLWVSNVDLDVGMQAFAYCIFVVVSLMTLTFYPGISSGWSYLRREKSFFP